jgi:multimeric flavodoxin WrbA
MRDDPGAFGSITEVELGVFYQLEPLTGDCQEYGKAEKGELHVGSSNKKVIVISGSPKKNGNTDKLIQWFSEGAAALGAEVTVLRASELKSSVAGCQSCRACQKKEEYGCVFKDDVADTLLRMNESDVIVMATPLYFFAMSSQLKAVVDRMFSLYKWDNDKNTMETKLKGKTLVLLASAYEDAGLKELEAPFRLTADYTGMIYKSMLVPNAGISGDITKRPGVREQAAALGAQAVTGSIGAA